MSQETQRTPSRWSEWPEADRWIEEVAARLGAKIPAAESPVFDHLHRALTMEDRLGEDLAAWVKSDRGNRAQFEDLLEGRFAGTDEKLPEALRDVKHALLDRRPAWADPEKMKVGARAHYRIGDLGRLASGTLGLLDGYRCAPVARALSMTGSLETATGRRIAETTSFMNSVLDSESVTQGSAGFNAAIRVRLVHAFVRHGLRRNPEWDESSWGIPVSVMDSLGTSMSFWVPIVIAAPIFGYSLSREEAEGMMTLWNYIGWLQGVPDELLPTSLEETYAIYLGILMQIGKPDEQSVKLAQAYIAAASRDGDGTSWLRERLVVSAASRLLPREHRDELGIEWTIFRHWWDAMRPLVRRADRQCHRDKSAYDAAVEKGRLEAVAQMPSDLDGHDFNPEQVIRDHGKLAA